ncbi:Putative FliC-like flagellin [Candidatus Trichorickettsia mobilis]|uniref:FliC-like flagellin n=1 Tax=Candidatus Trichorickettsia mobilis TaxID=1346319 RepID=A0ABZ0UQB8_9RICK|nr:hypothetical protein [Candidatus Trichorickettsia mobilis]WPY00242.1 Putative FliC-like flagellin [Candidatus Trichorickettsia mobilis]
MTDFINPITLIASNTMKANTERLREAGERLATGDRSKANIVDYVVGSQLRNTASVLKSVAKSAAYGINLLKVAQSTLLAGKQQLVGLQDIIAQANTANPTTLAALDALYKSNTADLNRQFEGASFDSRNLFSSDTSIAAVPLNVRVGILMTDTIKVTAPGLKAATTKLTAAGDLLTAANQGTAQTLIAAVDTLVTNGLASVGGQIESLKNASTALSDSIQVQDAAGDGYLNTNYEIDSNEFKAALASIKGAIATVVLADRLVQETVRLLD